LIFNYKCKPSIAAANPRRGGYKESAVATISAGLRKAIRQADAERYTWVPMPPSKAAGHSDYDDRLIRTLLKAFDGYNVDLRPLLQQSMSTEADHNTDVRLTPDELYALLRVDQARLRARPLRERIALFDDLLTTGKHFKCAERRLRELVPTAVPIVGVFVARRILPNPADEFEDLTQQ
jgi:predicted amidophosphoribosyltransferase